MRSLEVLMTEYEVASESSDRQAALMNSVQLLDKLTVAITPWYVRYANAIVVAVFTVSLAMSAMAMMFFRWH